MVDQGTDTLDRLKEEMEKYFYGGIRESAWDRTMSQRQNDSLLVRYILNRLSVLCHFGQNIVHQLGLADQKLHSGAILQWH